MDEEKGQRVVRRSRRCRSPVLLLERVESGGRRGGEHRGAVGAAVSIEGGYRVLAELVVGRRFGLLAARWVVGSWADSAGCFPAHRGGAARLSLPARVDRRGCAGSSHRQLKGVLLLREGQEGKRHRLEHVGPVLLWFGSSLLRLPGEARGGVERRGLSLGLVEVGGSRSRVKGGGIDLVLKSGRVRVRDGRAHRELLLLRVDRKRRVAGLHLAYPVELGLLGHWSPEVVPLVLRRIRALGWRG